MHDVLIDNEVDVDVDVVVVCLHCERYLGVSTVRR